MTISIPSVLRCKVSTLGLIEDGVSSIAIWPKEIVLLVSRHFNPKRSRMVYLITLSNGRIAEVSWYTPFEPDDQRLMERFDLVL